MAPFLPPVNIMSQLTFAEAEYAIKKRTTRREKFLAQLEHLVPWQKLNQQLSKGYKKAGPGRPPYPLETMLRIHIMQLVYNLSDPEMEDYLYEVESMRRFAHLRLSESIPDETTICTGQAKPDTLICVFSKLIGDIPPLAVCNRSRL